MWSNKTAIILTAWALTACATTNGLSATPIKTVERSVLPPVSAALLTRHQRPAPPENGTPEALLQHAARFGAYTQKLEQQVSGWQLWYRQEGNHE